MKDILPNLAYLLQDIPPAPISASASQESDDLNSQNEQALESENEKDIQNHQNHQNHTHNDNSTYPLDALHQMHPNLTHNLVESESVQITPITSVRTLPMNNLYTSQVTIPGVGQNVVLQPNSLTSSMANSLGMVMSGISYIPQIKPLHVVMHPIPQPQIHPQSIQNAPPVLDAPVNITTIASLSNSISQQPSHSTPIYQVPTQIAVSFPQMQHMPSTSPNHVS